MSHVLHDWYASRARWERRHRGVCGSEVAKYSSDGRHADVAQVEKCGEPHRRRRRV